MHIDSSLISIVVAFKKLAKGATIITHKLVLAQKRNAKLKAANKAATRRRSYKRKRVQREGALIVKEGERLAALKESRARGNREKAKKRVRTKVGEPSQRHCRRYSEAGHNTRTCKQVEVLDSK
jgi:hypothetical protein